MNTEFYKPASIKEAVDLLARYGAGAVVVNGGTDIVEKIAKGAVAPEAIIYIAGMEELSHIENKNGLIYLGGAVTYSQMLRDPQIQHIRGMVEAVSQLGSAPVRVTATPAGNIGTAAPSADCTCMLMALGSRVHLLSSQGERAVPLEEFFIKAYQNVRRPDELIRAISFPAVQPGHGTGYIRLARRKAQDIAKVLVGARITLDHGICTGASIGLGALNATAVKAYSIEKTLVGKNREEAVSFLENTFPKEAGLRPSRFTHYKELVTSTAVARAVAMAWDDAEGRADGK